ncbi:cytochrome c biogenesis protein ResB [Nocardioides sp.]|uniref:cytochrome c biogenesis protein ResB n=1 Tax=Nocardioides sp. TaxID=35761 RepID=UPI003516C730
MTQAPERPEASGAPAPDTRRPGELTARELLRWTWRQLTSMRTALVLLLLLALAAVPGSVIPQSGVDALAVSRWKDSHPTLTPIYERLQLFSVYDSTWFAAIYLLLMVSLVGCILPRLRVYLTALRAQPPAAPSRLTRLPDHRVLQVDAAPDVVLDRARAHLRSGRYRLRRDDADPARRHEVAAEKGFLREAGNLLFHASLLIVLVGFAMGGMLGYQGGVIVVQGQTFSNTSSAYDDFDPGSLFGSEDLDPFQFTVDDFTVDWITEGSAFGTARGFNARLSYRDRIGAPQDSYDLRVNHPLTIDSTDVFLIGHGYAPRITVRDAEGNITYSGPTVFLPQDQTFLSFGVVKAPGGSGGAVGLEGLLYPTFALQGGDPTTVFPALGNPLISMSVFTGDLGLDNGVPQSVYALDTDNATQVMQPDDPSKPVRLDLELGETEMLPDGLGSVSFDGVDEWVRIQISKSPGKEIALLGVVLALAGLLGSLFVRPRRVWVRTRDQDGVTMVEVAVLDRSGGADLGEVLDDLAAALSGHPDPVTQGTTGSAASRRDQKEEA